MLICTHPDQTARHELQIAVLMPDLACHRRYRSEERDWKLGFQGGVVLHSRSQSWLWIRNKVERKMSFEKG